MSVHILSTGPYHEVSRKQDGGERWCFQCRKKCRFDYVVLDADQYFDDEGEPTTAVWYGPIYKIECATCHLEDGDMFPGRYRIWGDE